MTIASALLNVPYHMNEDQRAIVEHQQGPLLIIAGPGSGKTRSLTLLAMNLLLNRQARPSELLLCTYTEKAVYELRDRLMKIAREVHYYQDLASLRIGTIHSICKQLLIENIHYTPIANDFTTLDQFTQQLLIFENLKKICGNSAILSVFLDRGLSRWQIATELASSFDKIAEELLFEQLKETYASTLPARQCTNDERLCYALTHAYAAYQKLLASKNCLDFAHLQKCVYNLLYNPEVFPHLTKGIRYVLVDEYQDTSYIQEQILRKLASATTHNNLFVVGDEDQALYRFRGATVRNILEFDKNFPDHTPIKLMTNYRSHQSIINTSNTWISSADWSNAQGKPFRTEKQARFPENKKHIDYTSVCTITAIDIYDEAEQFADLVISLKQQGKIKDYSQVALLLRSVKPDYSARFIEALQQRNIPYFCPRIDSYFTHEEIRQLIGCFARILGCEDTYAAADENDLLADYLATCQEQLKKTCLSHPSLQAMLFDMQEEIINDTQPSEKPGKSLLDYFYRLMTVPPFIGWFKGTLTSPAQPHNLEQISRYLQTFQQYYQHTGITPHNRQQVVRDFFQRFLYLLYNHGQNQAETAQQQYPEGHVPILTIHQAKGLEFPVVVVGCLDKISTSFSDQQKHRALQKYAHQEPFEPVHRSTEFDLRRLYYVAFSRAKALLVLMAVKEPGPSLVPLWQQLPPWSPKVISKMPDQGEPEEHIVPQPRYGLTSHIQLYATCPRQFHFFRAHSFAASPNGKYIAGQLVHRTLEYMHRMARDDKSAQLSEQKINDIFDRQVRALQQSHPLPIDEIQKVKARQQVLRYFRHNQQMLQHIAEAELQVQLDRGDYTLTGKIDLLIKTPSGTDLIDFKTLPRPDKNTGLLKQYEQQLHFYAHALEKSHRQRPDRLFLYWTTEECRENALEEIPYHPEKVQKMSVDIDTIVKDIQEEKFHVQIAPGAETCRCCDIRYLCRQDRVIEI